MAGIREDEKPVLEKETVFVVIHLYEGILYEVAVFQNKSDAVRFYEERIIECYGSLVEEQSGDDELSWQECEVFKG